MHTEEESAEQADTTSSLEKIKKQLNSIGASNVSLQGPLLKRSDIIRKWEWRWFALDVSTGKLEYWSHKGDPSPKGVVKFDAYSTVTVSSTNMMKEPRYDACCFYIITSQKKEYFFCAETPVAAGAWVATLRAAISVLKAHKEASFLLSGNAQFKLENVATVVATANVTAQKAAQDLQRSMKAAALSPSASLKKSITAIDMDSSDMMRETLKVKDEELHQLESDIKSRDLIIKELADRLSETADAAESAASSVEAIDEDCREALSEVDYLRKQLLQAVQQIREADARKAAELKFEETALQEAHRCRLELGKLRERGVILEAAMVRAEEDIRRLKVVHESEISERLKLLPTRMESTLQIEISLTDETLQEDDVIKAADVPSEVDESILEVCLSDATLPDAQIPELELAGSSEDVALGPRIGSDISSANTSAECAADLKELAPDGAPCTDGALPSLSAIDHHEYEVPLCPTASNLLEVAQSDDKAAPSQPCTSANCLSTTRADGCKDTTSKAIVMASESEDLDCISDGNNEIEIAVTDEVNMITTEGNELATVLELSEERTAVKQESYKREAYFRLCCF